MQRIFARAVQPSCVEQVEGRLTPRQAPFERVARRAGYRRDDGRYLHTLNTPDGFERKLRQLGIKRPFCESLDDAVAFIGYLTMAIRFALIVRPEFR